jgi:hypothetical protein
LNRGGNNGIEWGRCSFTCDYNVVKVKWCKMKGTNE